MSAVHLTWHCYFTGRKGNRPPTAIGGISASLFGAFLPWRRSALFPARSRVLLDPEPPRGAQSTGHHIFAGLRQPNMGHAHPSPAAGDRQENFGQLLDELGLLLRGKYQVSIAQDLRREGSEDPAAYPEVGRAHMGGLLGTFEA